MSSRPRLGGYEILGRLARGSTADIFLATPHLGDDTPAAVVLGLVAAGRRVVLKRLHAHLAVDEDFVRMFVDEVQLMSRFRHPHILGLIDLDDSDDSFFAVLELVDGPSASGALRVQARQQGVPRCGLPVDAAVGIVAAVADALTAVHALADDTSGEPLLLVHRDVNPQNVLIGRDGAVKLADFGVARSAVGRRSGVLTSRETTGGARRGKASYLAPEQILGHAITDADRPVDQRADLYALGATLWCLLTGAPPFVADGQVALFDAILQQETPRLRDHGIVEPALEALVASLLARDPTMRPRSAADVAQALGAFLETRGVAAAEAVRDAVVALGLPSLAT